MRDQSRLAGPSHLPEGRDAMCVKMWEEMACESRVPLCTFGCLLQLRHFMALKLTYSWLGPSANTAHILHQDCQRIHWI